LLIGDYKKQKDSHVKGDEKIKSVLEGKQYTWLVTGIAGFIGSNLLEHLLRFNQKVVGLDNFSTGHRRNLEEALQSVSAEQQSRFDFIEGDIRSAETCAKAMQGIDYVLHQAALASVPRSIQFPLLVNEVNVGGFLNILKAAVDAKVKRFVYASSSSVYGDSEILPKVETHLGNALSPYAGTKQINELYAKVFSCSYGIETIGLRYFNVFGQRQDPEGAYAAVIPLWFKAMLKGEDVLINGDGKTSRDFCYIENVVQANLLAAITSNPEAVNTVYNIAVGERTTLNELFSFIQKALSIQNKEPTYQDFRVGDIPHSLASIEKAKRYLGYAPRYTIKEGLSAAANWYRKFFI